ncbi:hypothetical protein [Paracoccus sp. (in: a-proteobacteria)]|uniref:hypothetical protein n=1 Tax=Paracoccus sp. TaxID=267 RepID=UPI00396C84EB
MITTTHFFTITTIEPQIPISELRDQVRAIMKRHRHPSAGDRAIHDLQTAEKLRVLVMEDHIP